MRFFDGASRIFALFIGNSTFTAFSEAGEDFRLYCFSFPPKKCEKTLDKAYFAW